MSANAMHVQNQLLTNEFVDSLKALSVSQTADTYADGFEKLNIQLKAAAPNGFNDNAPFAFSVVDNFYRIVPIIDKILSNGNENDKDFIQAKIFLQTLSNCYKDICLFNLFSLLKESQRLQVIFKHYIGIMKEEYFTDETQKYDHLLTVLIPFVAFTSILIPVVENDIPVNFLSYLLTYAKRYWKCECRVQVIQYILGLVKAFSKKPTLVPLIIRTGWPHACIQWLRNKDTENNARPSYIIDQYICLILQKLARHTAGVKVLNDLNCLKALDESYEQIKSAHSELQVACFDFFQCMLYALLTEADDIKQTSISNDNRMSQALVELVTYTIKASHDEYLCYKCFHISEILSVLSKLFNNDEILQKCLSINNEFFDCLCQLVIHFADVNGDIKRVHFPNDDETLLIVTNMLWSISFQKSYHEKFQTNSLLMHTLSNLATSASLYTGRQTKSIPKDICSLKKAAEGILWNLKGSTSPLRSFTNEKIDEQQQPLAMISYSHSDSTFCRQLVESLSAHIPVWVDYKQAHDTISHSDDLWEEIARAMEMATVIVLIVSKEYYDSKSCRQELSYASDALKKRIVPIYPPNQTYRASGWLGIRIAGQKYIHFGRKLFPDAVKELAVTILPDQKQIVQPSTPAPIPSSPPQQQQQRLSEPIIKQKSCDEEKSCDKEKPCEKIPEEETKCSPLKHWTTKDIRIWFDDNHIHQDLVTLYIDQFHTGTSLIVYARHMKLFYRNEYIRIFKKYYKIFQGKTLDTFEFITFVDALYRLREEYDPNYMNEDGYEKCHDQQIANKLKSLEDAGVTWL